jgi:glycosyltransferase involved in cell wall biosynthesis
MKLLYLTSESLSLDPIISSQVVPLLVCIKSKLSPTLLTVEPHGFDLSAKEAESGIKLSPLVRSNHPAYLLFLFLWLIINGRQFDVIHVRSYLPMIATLAYKLFNYNVKVIFDPRGLFAEELEYYSGQSIASGVFKWLERYFIRYSDAVIAVSNSMADYFAAAYTGSASKIYFIPTFAQLASADSLISVPNIRDDFGWEKESLLCYSGSLEGWQCFEEIVYTFSVICSRSSRIRFVFLSRSAEEMRMKISDRIPFDSYVVYSATPSELPHFLAQCDYGFLVRKPHIINSVAAPIKVKDYLLAGLRLVVTSEVGDSSDFISDHDCGIIVDYKDIASGNINYAQFEEPVPISDKIRISQIAATEFSLEMAVNKYLSLYEALLLNDEGARALTAE